MKAQADFASSASSERPRPGVFTGRPDPGFHPDPSGTPERLGVGDELATQPAASRLGHRLAYLESYLDTNIWGLETRAAAKAPGDPRSAPAALIASTHAG